jgi:hypothetical protein
MKAEARLEARPSHTIGLALPMHYHVECFDKYGNPKWTEDVHNVTCVDGLNYALSVAFLSGAAISSWFVGLKDSGSAMTADVISSHAAWSEQVKYEGATRPALSLGAVSNQAVDNSASKAVFTASASMNVSGPFVVSDSAKSGVSGTLFSVGDFSAQRVLAAKDVLNVTVTLQAGQKA